MRMYDIILKKRDGQELTCGEINFFINGYTKNEIPDYQASALMMAIYFQKMNKRETVDLTMAMVNTGDVLDLSKIEGIKIDKHSTGGVGDTTTLVLGPMVASLGIPVAKMSGRGLGHTGGTIDKLETIKGFSTQMSEEKFIENVNNIKLAVGSQTAELAPADKKLYSLRDVTATVDNISLISSSIMCKKIASGADCIVLDVKVGDGAFMKNLLDAELLAHAMVDIGNGTSRKTAAVLSDMDQPLGYAVGNILEVKEAIQTLKGNGPSDLLELCLTLGTQMVLFAKKAYTEVEARKMLIETIKNGGALNKFKEFVNAQGGDESYVDNTDKFERAKYILPVYSIENGFVKKIHAMDVGLAAMELGAGRASKQDIIDPSVGVVLQKKRGECVSSGDLLAYVHANNYDKGLKAAQKLQKCYEFTKEYKNDIPLIYEIIK